MFYNLITEVTLPLRMLFCWLEVKHKARLHSRRDCKKVSIPRGGDHWRLAATNIKGLLLSFLRDFGYLRWGDHVLFLTDCVYFSHVDSNHLLNDYDSTAGIKKDIWFLAL